MKRLIITILALLLLTVGVASAQNRTHALLSAATTTGDGTAVTLSGKASEHTCIVTLGGVIPTNVVVKLKGSVDNTHFVDLYTYTVTPTEKIANGTFTGALTSWTVTGGASASWTYGANVASKSAAGVYTIAQALADMTTAFVKGETYLLNYTTAFSVAGTVTPSMCGVTGTAVSTDAIQAQVFSCTASTGDLTFTPGATAMRATLDDVKLIRNEDGFHVVNKEVFYVKGSYVSRSGGSAATTVTMTCTSEGK